MVSHLGNPTVSLLALRVQAVVLIMYAGTSFHQERAMFTTKLQTLMHCWLRICIKLTFRLFFIYFFTPVFRARPVS